ncbi:MAG: hypothetical protein ABDH16_01055 [Thermodesulfovibrionaceae bacterium]
MRSRPCRKNDSAYAESKNWSILRAYRDLKRYDTDEAHLQAERR